MADPHAHVSHIIPLETSGHDEATTLGNWETMHNIIERQLGISPDAVEGCCRWDNGLLQIPPPDGSFEKRISWMREGIYLIIKSWFL